MKKNDDQPSQQDKDDFEKRIAHYGLTPKAVLQDRLEVDPSTRVSLTGKGSPCHVSPHILQTKDIGQVKQWIGLLDDVFDQPNAPRCHEAPNHYLPFGTAHARRGKKEIEPKPGKLGDAALKNLDLDKLRSTELDAIRQVARAYVRGDSRKVKAYKLFLEQIYQIFEFPLWIFRTVIVRSGSVLEFGPGNNLLCAWRVQIEEGGIIRSEGSLTVNATIVERI